MKLNMSVILLALATHASAEIITAPTSAQRDSANRAGLEMGQVGSNLAPKVDAAGNVVKDAAGNPVYQPNSRAGMGDMLKIFQSNTGLSDLTPEQSPTQGPSSTGSASVATSNYVDFYCPVTSGTVVSAGAYAYKLQSCSVSATAVASVTLKECTNKVNGGLCASDNDYGSAFTLIQGSYSSRGNVTYGLSCNTSKNCRLTVKSSFKYGANSDAMLAGGGFTNGTATNTMQEALTTGTTTARTASGQSMGQAMSNSAGNMNACLQKQKEALAQGKVITCDNTDPTLAKYASARPEKTVQEALGVDNCTPNLGGGTTTTKTTTYNRTCSRNISMTEKTTVYSTAADLKTCYQATKNNIDISVYSNQTYIPDAIYCSYIENKAGGQNDNRPDEYHFPAAEWEKNGYVLVGKGAVTCEHSSWDPESKSQQCYTYSYPKYYAKLGPRTEISSSAYPSAVAGACETSPSSDSYIETCASDGWFGRTLPVSECTLQVSMDDGTVTSLEQAIDYTSKPGCGVCVKPVVRQACVGTPTPDELAEGGCSDIPSSCTLVSSEAETFNTPGGIPTTIRDTYSCVQTVTVSNAPTSSSCVGQQLAGGLQANNPAADATSFNEAMVSAAMADQTAKNVDATGSGMETAPKIFGGAYAACSRPVGTFGGWLQKNCCDTGLRRPAKGNIIKNGCTLNDVKLAASRREGFSVYVGDWCSRTINLVFSKKCIERTEGYCMFPGLLPKLVQEQGRNQLAAMAAGSTAGDVTRGNLSYNYTSADNKGTWSTPVTVGSVRVAGWQWPKYCENSAEVARKRLAGEEVQCPGYVQTYLAVCENNGCGTLPEDPTINGSFWDVAAMDPLSVTVKSVTQHTTMKGACDTATGKCEYTASVWPLGKGGKAYTNRNLSWQLFSTQSTQTVSPNSDYVGSKTETTTQTVPGHWVPDSDCTEKCYDTYVPEKTITVETQVPVAANSKYYYNLTGVGNMEFKAAGLAGQPLLNTPLPSTIGFQYSLDAGSTWTSVDIPTNAADGFTIPGTEILLVGGCDKLINLCSYTMSAPIVVTAKPWGPAQGPDCSGFTAGQLAVLDFGKMDLSAFTAKAMNTVATNNPMTNAATVAAQQVAEFNSLMSMGKVKAAIPNSGSFAKVAPSNGMGPFDVKLAVSSFYPETTPTATNKVVGLAVDWDDCAGYQQVPVTTNGIFLTHTYQAPDSYACKGSPSSGITHNIKLQVQTLESGVITTTLEVFNAWDNLDEFKGANSTKLDTGVIKTAPNAQRPY